MIMKISHAVGKRTESLVEMGCNQPESPEIAVPNIVIAK